MDRNEEAPDLSAEEAIEEIISNYGEFVSHKQATRLAAKGGSGVGIVVHEKGRHTIRFDVNMTEEDGVVTHLAVMLRICIGGNSYDSVTLTHVMQSRSKKPGLFTTYGTQACSEAKCVYAAIPTDRGKDAAVRQFMTQWGFILNQK